MITRAAWVGSDVPVWKEPTGGHFVENGGHDVLDGGRTFGGGLSCQLLRALEQTRKSLNDCAVRFDAGDGILPKISM